MDSFVWRVILSFVIGGLYVGFVIWAAERFGSWLGGIITGLPSTILVSLIFIGLTSGDQIVHDAAAVTPAMITAGLVFMYVFVRAAKTNQEIALLIATVVWFLIAFGLVKLELQNIWVSFAIGILGMGIFAYLIRNYPKHEIALVNVSNEIHGLRILIAGTVIAGAVVAAHEAGAIWGGVLSMYPAMFTSTLYMLSKSQGYKFTQAFARQLPISAGATLIFLTIFYLLILNLKLWLTTLISLAGALLYAATLRKFKF